MPEVIILEDDPCYQSFMQEMIPEGVSCEIVETSNGLREALRQNPNTAIFILDDKVPPSPGEKAKYQFLGNAQGVLTNNPNAKIWYIGSAPGPEEIRFCSERGIQRIERTEIRTILEGLPK